MQRALKEAKGQINELQHTTLGHENSIKSQSEDIQKQKAAIESTNKNLENLAKTLQKQEKTLESFQLEQLSIKQTTEDHEKALKTHTDEINMLKKLLSQIGNTSGTPSFPIEALQDLEKKISAVDSKHTTTEEHMNSKIHELEGLIRSLRDNVHRNTEDIARIKKALSSLEDTLKSKVDITDFERFKNFRVPSEPGSGNVDHLLRMLEDMQKEIEGLKRKIGEMGGLSKSLEILTKKVNDLEEKLRHKMDTNEVLSLISGLKVTDGGSGKDPNIPYILKKLIELEQRIEAIMKLLEKPQPDFSELWSLYNDLRALLDTKASLADLKSLEERLQEKVIAVCEAMGNKFADRADTKKALKYLETLIREYFEFGSKKPSGEDAMFAKKPLGGWSCASCETNLEKLKGIAAAYYSWNKMPYRDPNDRIARAGPGFSRMLATIQPEALASRVKTATNKAPSQAEDDFPPEPRTAQGNKKIIRPMSAYHH